MPRSSANTTAARMTPISPGPVVPCGIATTRVIQAALSASPAHAAWPQLQAISILRPESWQYVLQYLLPGSAEHLQAG